MREGEILVVFLPQEIWRGGDDRAPSGKDRLVSWPRHMFTAYGSILWDLFTQFYSLINDALVSDAFYLQACLQI